MRRTIILAAAVLALTACAGTTPPHLSDQMTDTDLKRLNGAQYYAFHGTLSNQSAWSNIKTGRGGTVRALREFRDPETGLSCRKLVEHVRSVDGGNDYRIGTACKQPDGDLRVTYSDRVQVED